MALKIKPHGLHCDHCGSESFIRVRRKWWERMVYPDSKRYACFYCEKEYFVRNALGKDKKKPDKKSGSSKHKETTS